MGGGEVGVELKGQSAEGRDGRGKPCGLLLERGLEENQTGSVVVRCEV
jgi:hypothetical protein